MSKKSTSEAAPKSTPKDAQVMMAILKDMGVTEHEPRVINQMLEFTYRYVTDVLDDAKVYSTHAHKKNIDVDDVKLAIQCKLDHSFTSPPPRDLLLDVARHKNNTALPLIKPYMGPKLPPDRYCLASTNYRLKSLKKITKVTKPRVQLPGSGLASSLVSGARFTLQSSAGVKSVGNLQGSSLAIVTRSVTQPTMTIRPAQPAPTPAMPIIRVTPGLSSAPSISQPATISTNIITSLPNGGIKRKRDGEDDDYDEV